MKRIAQVRRNWQLYLLMLLPVSYIILFQYVPMFGLQIAFKNYDISLGMLRSPWAGLVHFRRFLSTYQFKLLMKNTISLSLLNLLFSFPFPVLLAISLNYLKSPRYKNVVQLATYAPHFISVVVMVGILTQLLSPYTGLVNNIIVHLGGKRVNFLGIPSLFRPIYIISGIWQEAGWGSIIYLSALSAIDPQLHEAAVIDGAGKVRRIWHIDLPGIMPSIVIMLIMSIGSIMNVGFQKVLLLQNPLNKEVSEVIDTYVYSVGIATGLPNYSYATAIGVFKSTVNLLLIVIANQVSRRVNETSLW